VTIKTTEEQLEAVQSAIEAVEGGQSVTWGGKTITRADLRVLYAREDRLIERYRREQGTGGPVRTTVVMGS
jgi:hypothetical protein